MVLDKFACDSALGDGLSWQWFIMLGNGITQLNGLIMVMDSLLVIDGVSSH